MGLIFCTGDIFETEQEVALAHGCNCAGAMGKGIAVEFKQRWPEMYRAYKNICKSGDFNPGAVFVWKDPSSKRIIFNLGTQRTWRTKATHEALETSLNRMFMNIVELNVKMIAMPLIGTGLGRIPEAEVKKILVGLSERFPCQIIVCDKYEKGKIPI